jgi:site-specific DNA recombinase
MEEVVVIMPRAILYSRVSTDKQAETGVSLEMQANKLRAQAGLHDYTVIAEIVDDGESACSLDRPGIQRALDMLKTGEADTLVVYKLDRLTRSLKDFQFLLEEFFMNERFTLVSICDSIDTRTATGRLVLNVMMSVFQWERESIGERTRDGLQHKKANGDVYCKRVYGYNNVDGRLEPNVDEQATIRQIIKYIDEYKWSFNSTANHLNSTTIPAPCGQKWYHHTVKAIYEREISK